MKFPKNQPIAFGGVTENCGCKNNNTQVMLANNGDVSHFQIKLEPCFIDSNILQSADFEGDDYNTDWTGSNYTIITNEAGENVAEFNGVSGSIEQSSKVQDNVYYRVGINVSKIKTGTLEVFFGEKAIGQITGTGYSEFFGFAEEDGDFIVKSYGSDAQIERIDLQHIETNVVAFIRKGSDDSIVSTIKAADYISKQSQITSVVALHNGQMTFKIDWNSFLSTSYGYYYIDVVNPCEDDGAITGINEAYFPIDHGEFFGDDGTIGWEFGTLNKANDFYINNGSLVFNSSITFGIGSEYIEQTGVLRAITYDVEINVTVLNDAEVVVEVDGVGAGTSQTISTTGVKNFQLTPANNLSKFRITCQDTGNPAGNAQIEYVTVTPNADPSTYTQGNVSNCFDYQLDHEETKVINASNGDNMHGLEFLVTRFNPTVRVKSYWVGGARRGTVEDIVDGDGVRRVIYAKTNRNRILRIDRASEHLHNWLSLLSNYSNVYIDNEQYFWNKEYEEIYRRYCFEGYGQVEVVKAGDTVEKQTLEGRYNHLQINDMYLHITRPNFKQGRLTHDPLETPDGTKIEIYI